MAKTAVRRRMVGAATGTRPRLPVEGVVTAIVAVTGTVDEVQDIIMPGAFTTTLKSRRPKLVWHHDWKDPLGRVLHIEEWKPGDPRLPKTGPGGLPWPAEAGAVVATVQFNLATQRGREMFEHVRAWAAAGEACWSIGYRVTPGLASKRADGVRVIYALELFEVSPVLHGAHPLTMALEVKAAAPGGRGLEVKETGRGRPVAAGICVRAKDTGRVLMLQRALTDDDPAAGAWEFPGGKLEPGEDPLDAARREWSEETGHDMPAGDLTGQWASGPYRGFVWEVPTEADLQLNLDPEDRHVLNPDDPDGDMAEVVAWWNPVQLPGNPAVRDELARSMRDVLDAVGAADPIRASAEAKTAARVVLEAKAMTSGSAGAVTMPAMHRARRRKRPYRRGSAKSAVAAAMRLPTQHPRSRMESKMARMPGSYEHRTEEVLEAVRDLLYPPAERDDDGTPMVYPEATFPDHVIVCAVVDGEKQTLRFPYGWSPDGVTLGSPTPVELEVVAVDADTAAPAEAGDVARFVTPAVEGIAAAAARLQHGPGMYGKALEDAVRPAVLGLLDALAVKGADVPGMVLGPPDDEEEDEEGYGDDYADDPGPAPLPPGGGGPVGDDAGFEDYDDGEDMEEDGYPMRVERKGVVVLDPRDVAAQLAALRA